MTDPLRQCEEAFLDPDWPREYRMPEMSEELYEDLRREREMEMAEQKIDDGGPIYCGCFHEHPGGETVKSTPVGGLSILDYFAGQALVGIISATYRDPRIQKAVTEAATEKDMVGPDLICEEAFDFAESMLAERKRRMGGQ